jgi:hypothetical protein
MGNYTFDISLSILNHLGRNLYRSFITVLGEAISNAWDANADNVYITIDRDSNTFTIRDDGEGMDSDDFQGKFLKIGYSKRKGGAVRSDGKNRPFIGRKGIGKLALLSCAKQITVISKKKGKDFVGGVIDNAGLDEAIKEDVSAGKYQLGIVDSKVFAKFSSELNTESGSIIIFKDVKDGIKNRVEYIRKLIALYFRFSLLDTSFNIFVNGTPILLDELNDLVDNTQFVWTIGGCTDPFVVDKIMKSSRCLKSKILELDNKNVTGFIASVDVPSHIKIRGTDEKVTIDLFVNGRLREKDILKHVSNPRIVSNYVYGQIHFDALDDDIDRFTSSREGVVSDDPKFKDLIELLDKLFKDIINDWDKWRVENHKEGDSENTQMTKKERKAKELVDEVSEDYIPKSDKSSKEKVKQWVEDLQEDASFNVSSYTECFISENLLRKFIVDQNVTLSEKMKADIKEYREKAEKFKSLGNVSIEVRENDDDLSYLAMNDLTYLADPDGKKEFTKASLYRDGQTYKPMRDAMAHTARLTAAAKALLTGTFENIKARVINLLSMKEETK